MSGDPPLIYRHNNNFGNVVKSREISINACRCYSFEPWVSRIQPPFINQTETMFTEQHSNIYTGWEPTCLKLTVFRIILQEAQWVIFQNNGPKARCQTKNAKYDGMFYSSMAVEELRITTTSPIKGQFNSNDGLDPACLTEGKGTFQREETDPETNGPLPRPTLRFSKEHQFYRLQGYSDLTISMSWTDLFSIGFTYMTLHNI